MGTAVKFLQALYNLWFVADIMTFLAYLIAIVRALPQVIAQKSLGPADVDMAGKRCQFAISHGKKVTLVIDEWGAAFGLARELYCQRVYHSMPGYEIKATDQVVDLGANSGLFTLMAAAIGANVIALEGQPGYLPIISENLRRNHCEERVAIEIGLVGAESGLFSKAENAQKFAFWGEGSAPLHLSEILERHNVKTVDLLKIDIEGSEFALLQGRPAWLKNVNKIAMEVHPSFGEVERLIKTLQELGFETHLRNRDMQAASFLEDELGYLFASQSVHCQL